MCSWHRSVKSALLIAALLFHDLEEENGPVCVYDWDRKACVFIFLVDGIDTDYFEGLSWWKAAGMYVLVFTGHIEWTVDKEDHEWMTDIKEAQ